MTEPSPERVGARLNPFVFPATTDSWFVLLAVSLMGHHVRLQLAGDPPTPYRAAIMARGVQSHNACSIFLERGTVPRFH